MSLSLLNTASKRSLLVALCMSFVLSLALPNKAAAATATDYFKTEGFVKQLYQLGLFWDRELLEIQTKCEGEFLVKPLSHGIVKPIKFAANGTHPTEGVWTFRYEFKRCDQSIIYNAFFSAESADKAPRIAPLVPGTTATSPMLMQDLFGGGLTAVVDQTRKDKECKTTAVLNTQVTMQPTTMTINQESRKGVWQERWTIKNCQEQFNMPLCFLPNEKGGTEWTNKACKG